MASSKVCFLVFILMYFAAGAHSAVWTSGGQAGEVIYACQGQTVSFPWQYLLSQGQDIRDIMWYYRGQSDELVAILTRGHFQTMPAFATRVSLANNAGLSIVDARLADSGNYSVEVTVSEPDNSLSTLRSHVVLHVSDSLMTTDGSLQVSMLPTPEFDATRNQFAIVLTCGVFTYIGRPPYEVIWKMPDSSTRQSSAYSSGRYQLRLFSPVASGTYSCDIPAVESSRSCVNHEVNGSIRVDGLEARVALLEANQEALRQQNAQLLQQLQTVGGGGQGVSFMTRLGSNVTLTHPGQRLLLDVVETNVGGGYDVTGALFTAPRAGTYFFALSTRCLGGIADAEIVVAGNATHPDRGRRVLCRVDSNVSDDMGSCQGVAHLAVADTVWVQTFETFQHHMCYRAGDTVFSGFLVHPDP